MNARSAVARSDTGFVTRPFAARSRRSPARSDQAKNQREKGSPFEEGFRGSVYGMLACETKCFPTAGGFEPDMSRCRRIERGGKGAAMAKYGAELPSASATCFWVRASDDTSAGSQGWVTSGGYVLPRVVAIGVAHDGTTSAFRGDAEKRPDRATAPPLSTRLRLAGVQGSRQRARLRGACGHTRSTVTNAGTARPAQSLAAIISPIATRCLRSPL